ncbi:unnamed protein product, partial [Staurois parvus]
MRGPGRADNLNAGSLQTLIYCECFHTLGERDIIYIVNAGSGGELLIVIHGGFMESRYYPVNFSGS